MRRVNFSSFYGFLETQVDAAKNSRLGHFPTNWDVPSDDINDFICEMMPEGKIGSLIAWCQGDDLKVTFNDSDIDKLIRGWQDSLSEYLLEKAEEEELMDENENWLSTEISWDDFWSEHWDDCYGPAAQWLQDGDFVSIRQAQIIRKVMNGPLRSLQWGDVCMLINDDFTSTPSRRSSVMVTIHPDGFLTEDGKFITWWNLAHRHLAEDIF